MPEAEGYEYDVFVSYPRDGDVETWVRNHLFQRLQDTLQENLGRKRIFLDTALSSGVSWPEALEQALRRSKVLLAVLSPQYFKKSWCLAELESMLERQRSLGYGTPDKPGLLVHAIVARDCEGGRNIPPDYRNIQHTDFSEFVYNFPDTDWPFFKRFADSVIDLADRLAQTVEEAPPWSETFPVKRPDAGPPEPGEVPRL